MSSPDDSEDDKNTASPASSGGDTEKEPSADVAGVRAEESQREPRRRRSKPDTRPRDGRQRSTTAATGLSTPRIVFGALVALGVGAAAGWFGHEAQAKAKLRREEVPATSGSATGSCGDWEKTICKDSGPESAACAQAKGATGLLTAPVCDVALQAMPATLAKVKSERAVCEGLAAKLCKELPEGSRTCQMVKERTPSFPRERCDEMLKNIDAVVAELKMMEQQGAGLGAAPGPGHGADDGHGH